MLDPQELLESCVFPAVVKGLNIKDLAQPVGIEEEVGQGATQSSKAASTDSGRRLEERRMRNDRRVSKEECDRVTL